MDADFNNYSVTGFSVVKKIPFPELQRIEHERDYEQIRNIWKTILQDEIKKEFMAQFELLEFILNGEDFKNNMRTMVITYSRIPLYN